MKFSAKPIAPPRSTRRAVVTWMRLARSYQRIDQASTEHLRSFRLSVAQFDVMAHLRTSEGATQQDLARALLVTKGNICQLLDRMEQRGLLRRRQEGRSNRVSLTEEGRALMEAAIPAQEECV